MRQSGAHLEELRKGLTLRSAQVDRLVMCHLKRSFFETATFSWSKKCRWSVSMASRGCHTDVMDTNPWMSRDSLRQLLIPKTHRVILKHTNTLFPSDSSGYPLHLELKLWADTEIKSRSREMNTRVEIQELRLKLGSFARKYHC